MSIPTVGLEPRAWLSTRVGSPTAKRLKARSAVTGDCMTACRHAVSSHGFASLRTGTQLVPTTASATRELLVFDVDDEFHAHSPASVRRQERSFERHAGRQDGAESVMKLKRLRINRLPGINEPFEIESDQVGFHVIYGPNEIGKSSICRAVESLLGSSRTTIVA